MWRDDARRGLLRPGTLVAGRWAIGDVLGRGAHAVVYRAAHAERRHVVALKHFEPGGAYRPAYGTESGDGAEESARERARFAREARLASRVRHPNLVRVLELGESERGAPFLVSELVVGETLAERLARGVLGVEEAIEVGRQALAALAALADAGIVHRDVRPANLVLARAAGGGVVVKLCDLGQGCERAARRARAARARGEGSLRVEGSPAYLAPEQVRSFGVDARADVYALGAVLYECLTGRAPVRGSHPDEILASVLRDAPMPIRDERSDCPAELERVIARALAKRPEDRWSSAAEMERALRAVAWRLGWTVRVEPVEDDRRGAPGARAAAAATEPHGNGSALALIPGSARAALPRPRSTWGRARGARARARLAWRRPW